MIINTSEQTIIHFILRLDTMIITNGWQLVCTMPLYKGGGFDPDNNQFSVPAISKIIDRVAIHILPLTLL